MKTMLTTLLTVITFLPSVFSQTGNLSLSVEENVTRNFNGINKVSTFSTLFTVNYVAEEYADSVTLKKYTVLNLDQAELTRLVNEQPDLLVIKIPQLNSDTMELKLVRYKLFNDDLKAIDYTAKKEIDISASIRNALFYHGISSADKGSWCAVSIFEDNLCAMVATTDGNYNLGKMITKQTYCLYNDRDRAEPPVFDCGSQEPGTATTAGKLLLEPGQAGSSSSSCPVTLRWIADYDFYVFCVNNSIDVAQALLNLFNNTSTLYQNDGLVISLSSNSIGWYLQPDGYSETDSQNAFLNFGYNEHTYDPYFTEDLVMFLALNINGNGLSIGVIDAFCKPFVWDVQNPSGRFAYARIENNFNYYPAYSATLYIVSHEMGHNFGSRHTHWCGWPGGPIDGCQSPPEPDNSGNSCFSGPVPPVEYTTLMSYCNNVYGSVNLANGFGYYPHIVVTNRFSESCNCRCNNQCVGIEELDSKHSGLMVVPNPATDRIELKLSDNNNLKPDVIEVLEITGAVVAEIKGSTIIDISTLPKGYYLVRVKTNNKILNTNFTRQ